MADPHLPGSTALIDSFLKDLQGIATLFRADNPTNPTRTIVFTSGTASNASWVADADYVFVGCTANTSSIQVFSLDATPNAILSSVDKVNVGAGLIVAQNFAGLIHGMRFPIPRGSKLWWSPAAAGEFANVFLERV